MDSNQEARFVSTVYVQNGAGVSGEGVQADRDWADTKFKDRKQESQITDDLSGKVLEGSA